MINSILKIATRIEWTKDIKSTKFGYDSNGIPALRIDTPTTLQSTTPIEQEEDRKALYGSKMARECAVGIRWLEVYANDSSLTLNLSLALLRNDKTTPKLD